MTTVDFGYTGPDDLDSITLDMQHNWRGTAATTGEVGGTLDSISMYLSKFDAGNKVKCIVQNADLTLLGVTEERTDGGPNGWFTFNFSEPKPTVTASTKYFIGAICDGTDDVDAAYSNDNYLEGVMRKTVSYGSSEVDFDSWTETNGNNHLHVLGTYTLDEEGPEPQEFSETITSTDSLAKQTMRSLPETITSTASLTKITSIVLSETGQRVRVADVGF